MQAANEGVHVVKPEAPEGSLGIRVDLPFEQNVNAFVTDAFVVVPGGIGTVLETMMVWQLLQVRKLHNTPLILAGQMYAELVDWCRKSMLRSDFPLASPEDMTIPVCVEDGPAIVRLIREHHAAWKQPSD